jgi:hypothetical protein
VNDKHKVLASCLPSKDMTPILLSIFLCNSHSTSHIFCSGLVPAVQTSESPQAEPFGSLNGASALSFPYLCFSLSSCRPHIALFFTCVFRNLSLLDSLESLLFPADDAALSGTAKVSIIRTSTIGPIKGVLAGRHHYNLTGPGSWRSGTREHSTSGSSGRSFHAFSHPKPGLNLLQQLGPG